MCAYRERRKRTSLLFLQARSAENCVIAGRLRRRRRRLPMEVFETFFKGTRLFFFYFNVLPPSERSIIFLSFYAHVTRRCVAREREREKASDILRLLLVREKFRDD